MISWGCGQENANRRSHCGEAWCSNLLIGATLKTVLFRTCFRLGGFFSYLIFLFLFLFGFSIRALSSCLSLTVFWIYKTIFQQFFMKSRQDVLIKRESIAIMSRLSMSHNFEINSSWVISLHSPLYSFIFKEKNSPNYGHPCLLYLPVSMYGTYPPGGFTNLHHMAFCGNAGKIYVARMP